MSLRFKLSGTGPEPGRPDSNAYSNPALEDTAPPEVGDTH